MTRGRPPRDAVFQRCQDALEDLNQRFGGLPSLEESAFVWRDIWHMEAHHSTALEGNTLVLKEVEKLLEADKPVGGKPLKEYLEVKGYADAAQWVYSQTLQGQLPVGAQLIGIHEIREIHHMLMGPVWAVAPHPDATGDEMPGSFRRHELYSFGKGMQPPTWPLVEPMLAAWVEKANEKHPEDMREFMEWLAQLHCEFEHIHPFIDGNGRTGRLVLNLILVRPSSY